MTQEELNIIKENTVKEAERFFQENEVEIRRISPSICPYFVPNHGASEYRTIKLSNSTNPMASF